MRVLKKKKEKNPLKKMLTEEINLLINYNFVDMRAKNRKNT